MKKMSASELARIVQLPQQSEPIAEDPASLANAVILDVQQALNAEIIRRVRAYAQADTAPELLEGIRFVAEALRNHMWLGHRPYPYSLHHARETLLKQFESVGEPN